MNRLYNRTAAWYWLIRFILVDLFTRAEKAGLSLSFCVKAILMGRHRGGVTRIVSATSAQFPQQWAKVFEIYNSTYWRDYPLPARILVWYLRRRGKLEQPRLNGQVGHNICDGIWIKEPIQFVDQYETETGYRTPHYKGAE